MANSYDAITWAIRARGISAGAYRLLIALAKRVGRRGFDVWPSYAKMAEDAEMSVASARRNIEELIGARLIEKIATARQDGSQSSNIYRLQVHSAHDFERSPTQWIRPDDGQEDDDDEPGDGVLNLSRGGAQFELGGVLTGEQGGVLTGEHPYELESDRTNTIEESLSDDDVIRRFREAWDQLAEDVPGFGKIRTFSDTRAKHLLARVAEHGAGRSPEAIDELFKSIFDSIRGSRLLRGLKIDWRVPGPDWIVNKTNFNKIMEGSYAQDFNAASPRADVPRDRDHVAAGQAARDVLRRIYGESGVDQGQGPG